MDPEINDQMKVAHGSNRLIMAINRKFKTELTRSSLRSSGHLELLWLDPGILISLHIDENQDLQLGWVRPEKPSSRYLKDVWEPTEVILEELGQFQGVVKRG